MAQISKALFRVSQALCFVFLLDAPVHAFSNTEQIDTLNTVARAAYAAGKDELLARRGPVIIVGGDMVLLANGTELHADYTPQSYTNLKTIAHICLGTVGLMQAFVDDPAASSAKWRPHLEALREQSVAIVPVLGTLQRRDAHGSRPAIRRRGSLHA